MTVPGKLYYKITELSGDKWPTTTKGDILEWCLADHFPLYVHWDGMQAVKGLRVEKVLKSLQEAALLKGKRKKRKKRPIVDHSSEEPANGKHENETIIFFQNLYAEMPTEVIAKMVFENEDPVQDTLFIVPGEDGDFFSGVATENGFEDIPYSVYKRELLVSGTDVEKMEAKYPTLTDGTGDLTRVTTERKQEEFLGKARLAILSATLEAKAENLENAAKVPVSDLPQEGTPRESAAIPPPEPGRRYPPKLEAAVDAFNAVFLKPLPKGKTPSQAVRAWLTANFDKYEALILPRGIKSQTGADLEGQPNQDAIKQIAKIVNWQPKGGAPKTP